MTDVAVMPWDQPPQPEQPVPELTLELLAEQCARYREFLDSFLRMRVTIDGKPVAFVSIKDEGNNLEATTKLPDGRVIVFELLPGAPRSNELMMTAGQLIQTIMHKVKEGEL